MVLKNSAPGKLSYKESVMEAEEAWASLHRLRRLAGLVPRTTLCTASLNGIGVGVSAPPGEDDDVSFLTPADGAAVAAIDMMDSITKDSAFKEKEGQVHYASSAIDSQKFSYILLSHSQDLLEPPSMSALEESVEVNFPLALFGAAMQHGSNPILIEKAPVAVAEKEKSGKSHSSSKSHSKRRASAGGEGSDITPSLVAAAGTTGVITPTVHVPGQKRGSYASSLKPWGSANNRNDKNSHLASAEEILRFRAAVEYLLPEDVTTEDYRRCFEEGRFKTSLCPLPLPPMDCIPSPTKLMQAAVERQQLAGKYACSLSYCFGGTRAVF